MPLDDTNWPIIETEADEATALLVRARALVARGWCRWTPARNRFRFAVSPYSRSATRWCMSGALDAAALISSDLDRRRAVIRLRVAMGDVPIACFNDAQKTVEPILEAFDRAIAASNPVAAGS
jgi:hypothetical protein